jgi:hypothetical protein
VRDEAVGPQGIRRQVVVRAEASESDHPSGLVAPPGGPRPQTWLENGGNVRYDYFSKFKLLLNMGFWMEFPQPCLIAEGNLGGEFLS